jgi:hypothetical protein
LNNRRKYLCWQTFADKSNLYNVLLFPRFIAQEKIEMKFGTKIILLSLVVFVGIFATACPERVSIADIEANPSRYQNKDIAIAGTVRDSWGINIPGTGLRGGAYQVSDGTGSIWVLTDNAVPVRGSQLGVQGRVGSGFTVGGRTFGLGMQEKKRKFRRN